MVGCVDQKKLKNVHQIKTVIMRLWKKLLNWKFYPTFFDYIIWKLKYICFTCDHLRAFLSGQLLGGHSVLSGIPIVLIRDADLPVESISKKCQLTLTANNTISWKRGKGKSEVFISPDFAFLNLLTGCTLVASYDKLYGL